MSRNARMDPGSLKEQAAFYDRHWTDHDYGWILFAFQGSYATMNVAWGGIMDRLGIRLGYTLAVIWWSFATIYKDGTWDAGSFMVGHENLGYAIFQNERGEVRTTTDIEGEVVHKPGSYFVASARIVLDGEEQWEYLPDPRGEMIDFVGGFPITAQQEGRWRRVGDTREPDRWIAWGETDRRNGSARNVRGADL